MATNTQFTGVGFDTPAAERSTRSRQTTRRVRHGAYPRGVLRFATGIVLIVALAAAGFGAASYTRAARSEKRVATLQTELTALQQRIAGDEQAAAGAQRHAGSVVARANAAQRSIKRFSWQLQSVPSEAQLAGLRNQVAAYAACLPQLQREINGLRLSWRIDATKPSADSFKLFTSAPASASCSTALAGG
jgi:hypothetical protein